jgi:uncharacterized Zn finger protein (UPF0148 family)/transposase-like protein
MEMVGNKIVCPRCGKEKFWKTKDGRLKCKNCRYLFKPKINPFNIPNDKLREIISEFLLEHSIDSISLKVQISKYKLIKILTILRKLMLLDLPEEIKKFIKIELNFENEVKRKPIIGIFSYKDWVFAKVLTDIRPKDIKSFIENTKNEPIENWQKNLGLVYNKNLYRLSEENEDVISYFWEYLRNKLSSKGGIRKEKLPLYLGEYVWRFNYRKEGLKEKEERLFNLLNNFFQKRKTDII